MLHANPNTPYVTSHSVCLLLTILCLHVLCAEGIRSHLDIGALPHSWPVSHFSSSVSDSVPPDARNSGSSTFSRSLLLDEFDCDRCPSTLQPVCTGTLTFPHRCFAVCQGLEVDYDGVCTVSSGQQTRPQGGAALIPANASQGDAGVQAGNDSAEPSWSVAAAEACAVSQSDMQAMLDDGYYFVGCVSEDSEGGNLDNTQGQSGSILNSLDSDSTLMFHSVVVTASHYKYVKAVELQLGDFFPGDESDNTSFFQSGTFGGPDLEEERDADVEVQVQGSLEEDGNETGDGRHREGESYEGNSGDDQGGSGDSGGSNEGSIGGDDHNEGSDGKNGSSNGKNGGGNGKNGGSNGQNGGNNGSNNSGNDSISNSGDTGGSAGFADGGTGGSVCNKGRKLRGRRAEPATNPSAPAEAGAGAHAVGGKAEEQLQRGRLNTIVRWLLSHRWGSSNRETEQYTSENTPVQFDSDAAGGIVTPGAVGAEQAYRNVHLNLISNLNLNFDSAPDTAGGMVTPAAARVGQLSANANLELDSNSGTAGGHVTPQADGADHLSRNSNSKSKSGTVAGDGMLQTVGADRITPTSRSKSDSDAAGATVSPQAVGRDDITSHTTSHITKDITSHVSKSDEIEEDGMQLGGEGTSTAGGALTSGRDGRKERSARVLSQATIDNRTKVSATMRFPHWAIGKLTMTNKKGTVVECSGSFISPVDFITSAHCILNTTNNMFFLTGYVVPALARGVQPYGKLEVESANLLQAYVNLDGWSLSAVYFDVAVVRVSSPSGAWLPMQGTLSYAKRCTTKTETLRTCGYAEDVDQMTTQVCVNCPKLTTNFCSSTTANPNNIITAQSCFVNEGQSGSPLMVPSSGLVVGMLSGFGKLASGGIISWYTPLDNYQLDYLLNPKWRVTVWSIQTQLAPTLKQIRTAPASGPRRCLQGPSVPFIGVSPVLGKCVPNATSQKWTRKGSGKDALRIKFSSTTLCLDVQGKSRSSGAKVVLQTCSAAAGWSQMWFFDFSKRLRNGNSPNLCLSAVTVGTVTNLVLETCNSTPRQQWTV